MIPLISKIKSVDIQIIHYIFIQSDFTMVMFDIFLTYIFWTLKTNKI